MSKAKTRHSSITNISEFIGPGKDFIPTKHSYEQSNYSKKNFIKRTKKHNMILPMI